jgi:hypothetical protein
MEDLSDGLDEQGLGQPGHAGQQTVPAGEERNQHLIDDVVLADDDFAELAKNATSPLLYFRCKTGHSSLRLSTFGAPAAPG